MTETTTIQIPEAFEPLFTPAPYKTFYGGRGAARSWSFATALLIYAAKGVEHILCAREIQNSIEESVHKNLCDRIPAVEKALNCPGFFTITKTAIRGRNGSDFFFKGLRSNPTAIKSLENITKCWVEEGEKVSDYSWELLDPTLRVDGAELWISMNTGLETDPTYQRYVLNAPPGSVVKLVTYKDNPFFPDTLKKKMEHCKATDEATYNHVWLGGFRVRILGKKVYPEFSRKMHVAASSLKPADKREILVGWDNTGLSPAILLSYLTNTGQWRMFKEFCFEDTGIADATEAMILWCNANLDPECTYKDISDPAGKTRDSAKGSPEEYACEAARKYNRVLNFEHGVQTFKFRREAVAARLTKLINGEPALQIDPHDCPMLINGFDGGYVYPEIANTGIYKDDPAKNEYSHIHDATQYIATRVFAVNESAAVKRGPDPRDDPRNYVEGHYIGP